MGHITQHSAQLKDGRSVTLRSPLPGDASEILRATKLVFANSTDLGTEADEFTYTTEQEADILRASLQCPRSVFITAFGPNGEAVGTLSFRPGQRRRLAHQGQFGIALCKDWRGVGLGSAMIRALLAWAEDNFRLATVRLSVATRNRSAVGVYTKLGFSVEGTERGLMRMENGDPIDCLSMARDVSRCFVPTLSTDRLVLQPLDESMEEGYRQHFIDYEVVRNLNGAIPWPYPEAGVSEFLRRIVAAQGRDRWAWGLFLKTQPTRLIGVVDLWRQGNPEHRGFWLAQAFWRQGLMTEACDRVTEYAFSHLGFDRLILSNAVGNSASRRIKEKAGAVLIGVRPAAFVDPGLKEAETWELTKERWQAQP